MKRIVTFISAPSEIKEFVIYTFIVILTNCSGLITNTIKTGLIGKNLGTLPLDAYVIVNAIISISSYILLYFTSGLTAQIAQHLAKNEFEMIGRRMNTAQMFTVFVSIFLALALWLSRDLFLFLYNPSPDLREMIIPFYNANISIVPLIMLSTTNGGIMIGLRALFPRMVIEFVAISIDVGLLSLFLLYFKLGIFSILYSYLIARFICETFHYVYLYQPANIRKFQLFTRFAWRFMDKIFLTSFLSDSGYLVGRGVVLLSQYIMTPIIASRLGPIELAGFTVMSTLFFYPTIISDSIGIVCNIKGSQYIGLKKFSYFNRLVIICPLVSLLIAFLFLCVYGIDNKSLFETFTSDPLVLSQTEKTFPYFLFGILLASLPGTFEGLTMSKQNFALLFVVMVASMAMWVPITCINLIWFEELPLIYAAVMVFMWTRFLPLMVIIYWEMYRERNWVDGVDPFPEEKKLVESPLIVNF